MFLLTICFFEPDFVEIRFRDSVFFNFRSIAQLLGRKIIKMVAILKRNAFFQFLADNHSLTYCINGAIFIRKFLWESGFRKGGP